MAFGGKIFEYLFFGMFSGTSATEQDPGGGSLDKACKCSNSSSAMKDLDFEVDCFDRFLR